MLPRHFLTVALSAAGSALVTGHRHRQSMAYRLPYLLLFTTRDDPGSDGLGERPAAKLLERLAESRAVDKSHNARCVRSG